MTLEDAQESKKLKSNVRIVRQIYTWKSIAFFGRISFGQEKQSQDLS